VTLAGLVSVGRLPLDLDHRLLSVEHDEQCLVLEHFAPVFPCDEEWLQRIRVPVGDVKVGELQGDFVTVVRGLAGLKAQDIK
jgi:hypothetical protein